MHPIRKQRLLFISFFLVALALACALALFALKQNINVFYTPSQLSQVSVPLKQTIRVGGLVKKASVSHQNSTVSFVITDGHHDLTVHYQGLLPDLFREGQGIVTEGKLRTDGALQAAQVLAKHDENYMPPQVAESIPADVLAALKQSTDKTGKQL